jgi:hypothetical protein
MGLFSRKQEVRTEEFCRQRYDYWIALLDSSSANALAVGKVLQVIEKEDFRFTGIPLSQFLREIVTFQFEAFSHVWQGRFSANGKHLITQGTFTKRYLAEKGLVEIWDGMDIYNQFIPRVNTTYQNPGSAFARAGRAMANQTRADTIDYLRASGCDNEVAICIANRAGDLRPWTRPDHALQIQLAIALAGRLKPEIVRPVLESLKILIEGFYRDFWDATKNIKIVD